MTSDETIHGMRLRVIKRAQVLGNVSAVCRELGISRTVFYRWRKLERYGVIGVHPHRPRAQAGRPVAMTREAERLVLGISISAANWRFRRIAAYLHQTWRARLAPTIVHRLRRVGSAMRSRSESA
jgi:transposase-like protein